MSETQRQKDLAAWNSWTSTQKQNFVTLSSRYAEIKNATDREQKSILSNKLDRDLKAVAKSGTTSGRGVPV